jgi:hypothetical protein
MKKIFTLMFATVLFSAAAFAQKRYHKDNSYIPSYQYQSNGYADNGNHWKDDNVGYKDRSTAFQKRDWDDNRGDRFMNDKESVIGRSRFYNDNYDRYHYRKNRRLSFQVFFGERNRF